MSVTMEEVLWRITRQSQTLFELRQEIKGIWDDDAAQEIGARYLTPHAAACADVHNALELQSSDLIDGQDCLIRVNELIAIADRLSERVGESLVIAEQESQQAYASYSQYVEHRSTADELLPQIYALINKANQSCDE